MELYDVLERLQLALRSLPYGDLPVSYQCGWSWVPKLTEALLNDLEGVTGHRGCVQDARLWLSTVDFGSGYCHFEVFFKHLEQFSVSVECTFANDCRVRLRVLNEAEGQEFRRAAQRLAGPNYDNGWLELATLSTP